MYERVGLGIYVASEAHSVAYGRSYKPGATLPIIYFTGGPGQARDYLTASGSGRHIPPVLTRVGLAVASAEFGGAAQWANPTTETRIGQLWTQVKNGGLNPPTTQFIGIGVSKGCPALENYIRAHAADVAALVEIVPANHISNYYDEDREGLASQIDAAYGGNWAASAATRDPTRNVGSRPDVPTLMIYGENDELCLAEEVLDYASDIGAETRSMGATEHLTTAPAIDPVEDILAFIHEYV